MDAGHLLVEIIPLLSDNYGYLVIAPSHRKLLIVDPSEASPVLDVIQKKFASYKVEKILLTHHHHDHVGGAEELAKESGCKIYCSDYDLNRLPYADYGFLTKGLSTPKATATGKYQQAGQLQNVANLQSTDDFDFAGERVDVHYIPGHTLGHIAYYFTQSKLLFSGDTLFSAGCGRLFEGSAEQMHQSLQKLAKLPTETKVYCGHEYTEQNLKFAIACEPESMDIKTYISAANEIRARGLPTVPSTIGIETQVNPFLRVKSVEEFRKRRLAKDSFK